MLLFYTIVISLFLTALIFVIGRDHPNLFMFINLFVSIVTILYMILKDYERYLIVKPINV